MHITIKILLVFLMAFTLASCEKDADVDNEVENTIVNDSNSEYYYVTYIVEGQFKQLSGFNAGGATYYVNGIQVKLPYIETIGPVEKGYACSMTVVMSAKNADASFSAKILVNDNEVCNEIGRAYANKRDPVESSVHLEYIIR